jgi:Tol biopolymer transport system component/DNA-binding winged helix-turn-helix (wHTH) protein
MSNQARTKYEFGPFFVDPSKRLLSRDGENVALTPKCFDILLILIESCGEVVTKDDLIKRVWPDTYVEEGNLTYNISVLRKALGERAGEHQYIVTVPGRGYQFVEAVKEYGHAAADLMEHTTTLATQPDETFKEAEPVVAVEADRSRSLDASFASPQVQHKRRWPNAAAILLTAAAGVSLGLYLVGWKQFQAGPEETFGKMKMVRLTTNGVARVAAISPDGKYMAHAIGGRGEQSLWLRHIATGSDTEVIPRARVIYGALSFSPDGNYIYFARSDANSQAGVVYRVPVLGGSIQKLADDVDSAISFSPDGRQIAFIRGYPERAEAALLTANADGTGEQALITRRMVDVFPAPNRMFGPAWSPDGEAIALAIRKDVSGAKYWDVMTVSVKDHTERQVTFQKWPDLGMLTWLSDGSGLIATAADEESSPAQQIWHISYPKGDVRRITNDPNDYDGVTLTTDSTTLLTVQLEQSSNVWVAPGGDGSPAAQITSNNSEGIGGISWTPDGRIVYTRRSRASSQLWIMNADGTGQSQLTVNDYTSISPSVSADGRFVVFSSDRTGTHSIWRMDIDGNNPKQLTHEMDARTPDISTDGKWVVYGGSESGVLTLWKVSIDGGDSVQLTDYFSRTPQVSPDGKQLAFVFMDERVTPKRLRNAITTFDGGPPAEVFDLAPRRVGWARDGRALTYQVGAKGVANIWAQPLDRSAPVQLTNFTTDMIFAYALSVDGKQIACARGKWKSDAVLIRNIR